MSTGLTPGLKPTDRSPVIRSSLPHPVLGSFEGRSSDVWRIEGVSRFGQDCEYVTTSPMAERTNRMSLEELSYQ